MVMLLVIVGETFLHKSCEIKFENEQINPRNNEYKELCKSVYVQVCVLIGFFLYIK